MLNIVITRCMVYKQVQERSKILYKIKTKVKPVHVSIGRDKIKGNEHKAVLSCRKY